MSPSIEHEESPAQYIGKGYRNSDVYAVIIDLKTPDDLSPEDFDKCIQAIIASEKLAFPYSAITVSSKFKWIGFKDKLVLFDDGYEHFNVADLLLSGGFVQTPPVGAGHLAFMPPNRHFWGSSQTLTEDGLDLTQSRDYKLKVLPELLGKDGFSFE